MAEEAIVKTEPITGREDLTEAKSQNGAMNGAKIDLKSAVDKSVATTSGSRAVSVTPGLKDGHAVASVILLVDKQLKTMEQPLE